MESAVLHLKPVFDACDQNGDGFVKTQDLLLLSQEHSTDGFEVCKWPAKLTCNIYAGGLANFCRTLRLSSRLAWDPHSPS